MEVVTGNEPDEGEKDGGGWVVVGTQRKTREEPSRMVESRTGRIRRLYPALLTLHDWKVDILERLEAEIGEEALKEKENVYNIGGICPLGGDVLLVVFIYLEVLSYCNLK